MYDDRKRDLSPEERRGLEDELEARLKASCSVEGVWFTVHDDRSRAVDEGKRDLGTGAAALAQELLKAADELMRMAGNSIHNSPNGFDVVAEGVLLDTDEKLLRAMQHSARLRRQLHEWVHRGGWREAMAAERARREAAAGS